jgi:tetratricopeptide (TPR) repeat protein
MALLSVAIVCFVLMFAPPLCGAAAQASDATSAPNQTPNQNQLNTQVQGTLAASTAPVVPTPAEMRDMAASQLEEIGDQLREARDYRSAVTCYREAIRKVGSAVYYNKIAISELMLQHPVEAEKAAKKAVHKNRFMSEAWNNLGVSYYVLRQYNSAIRGYQRAISINPHSASFHGNLAAAFVDSQQFERGMAEYRKAFEIDPLFFEHRSPNGVSGRLPSPEDRAQFAFIMARLFAGKGDMDRALHFLRAAIEDGYPKIDEVYRDQEFASVRKDERFRTLMKDRPAAVR